MITFQIVGVDLTDQDLKEMFEKAGEWLIGIKVGFAMVGIILGIYSVFSNEAYSIWDY
jgi:hypothetical protein